MPKVIEMTRAEFEAKLRSGEISLVPPKQNNSLPKFEPARFSDKKAYQDYLINRRTIIKDLSKINDPKLSDIVNKALNAKASISSIKNFINAYKAKNRVKGSFVPDEVYKRLEDEVLSLNEPNARAEAYAVLNDPTMSTENKIKAIGYYKKTFNTPKEQTLSKEERIINKITKLKSLPSLNDIQKEKLKYYEDLLAKYTSTAMDDLGKKDR